MNQTIDFLIQTGIPVLLAGGLVVCCFCVWAMQRRLRMRNYNRFVQEEYTNRGQQTPPLILRIQNEYIQKYNCTARMWLGGWLSLRTYAQMDGRVDDTLPSPSFRGTAATESVGMKDEAKPWKGRILRMIRWTGIALLSGLLIATADVKLHREHFNLLVMFLCAITIFLIVNRWLNRRQRKINKERLCVVDGFEISETSLQQRKKDIRPGKSLSLNNREA